MIKELLYGKIKMVKCKMILRFTGWYVVSAPNRVYRGRQRSNMSVSVSALLSWPTSSLQSHLHRVGRCVSPVARDAVRTTGAYFSRLAPCCSLWTPKSRVWALRYGNVGLSRKYAGPNTIVGSRHTLPARIVPVRFYEELVKRWMHQKVCEFGPQTEPRLTVRVSGREPERPFAPRARTFLGSHPVVLCETRKVVFGRYGMATLDCRENTPDQTPSSAVHIHYRRG